MGYLFRCPCHWPYVSFIICHQEQVLGTGGGEKRAIVTINVSQGVASDVYAGICGENVCSGAGAALCLKVMSSNPDVVTGD